MCIWETHIHLCRRSNVGRWSCSGNKYPHGHIISLPENLNTRVCAVYPYASKYHVHVQYSTRYLPCASFYLHIYTHVHSHATHNTYTFTVSIPSSQSRSNRHIPVFGSKLFASTPLEYHISFHDEAYLGFSQAR